MDSKRRICSAIQGVSVICTLLQ